MRSAVGPGSANTPTPIPSTTNRTVEFSLRGKFASQSHGPARVEHPKIGDSALRLIEERKVVTNAVNSRNVVSTPMF
jgi:hypothetical protein